MLRLAFRNLTAHPARNAFTAFSVMLAMLLVAFVVAAQMQTNQRLDMLKGRNNMLVTAKGQPMTRAFQTTIERIPGVQRVMYMIVEDGSSADKKKEFMVHATTKDYMTIGESWFYVPESGIEKWEGERTGAIFARHTARDLGLSVGDRTTINTPLGPIEVVVSAISTKGYKTTGAIVHYDYYTELFKMQNKVNVFWVGLEPTASLKDIAGQVDDASKNTDAPTRSFSSAAHLKGWAQAGKVIPTLLTGAGIIILIATLLVTANTIAIGIRERIPELATLRAIGFRRRKILTLLISEVMIVCLTGGLLGGLLPLIFFRSGVEMGAGKLVLGKVELPPDVLLWVLALSALMALVASGIPAWRASRADIATTLRANA